VSLQSENSEPAESEHGEAGNPLCFSFAPRSDAERVRSCNRAAADDKLRRGILAGRRELLGGGIVKVVELYDRQPLPIPNEYVLG